MRIISGSKIRRYVAIVGIFLAMAAFITGIPGCGGGAYNPPPSENLEIRTWYDLDAVRDNLAGNHTLMNDLDSTTAGYEELASPTANGGKGWQPIGFATPYGPTAYVGFAGTFDGQGHKIRDLYINRPGERWAGLFGSTDPEGVIRDISVMNATVIGDEYVGGLLAVTNGPVSNCYCSGKVTGNNDVGGLVGVNNHGTVYNSYFTGSVTGVDNVGGVAGRNNGAVSDSYSTGNVTGESHVGGLAGCQSTGIITNSYSTGSVTGSSSIGGLVGTNYAGPVTNSFWDTETSGQSTSDGGTGKNTTEMQDVATFSGAGWNITAVPLNETNSAYIWNIVNNVTYPFLSWQS
jgi:hypothetical protein